MKILLLSTDESPNNSLPILEPWATTQRTSWLTAIVHKTSPATWSSFVSLTGQELASQPSDALIPTHWGGGQHSELKDNQTLTPPKVDIKRGLPILRTSDPGVGSSRTELIFAQWISEIYDISSRQSYIKLFSTLQDNLFIQFFT